MESSVPLQDQNARTQVQGGKRAREAHSGTDIPGVIAHKCCALMCTTFFTVKEVEEMREEYWTLNQGDQRKYLKRAIRDARGSYSLYGRGACEEAFLMLLKVGRRRFWDIKKGSIRCPIQRCRKPKDSTVFAQDWLESYFKLYGDRLPDRQEFSLPSCLTKTTIFEQYEAEVGHSAGLPLVSRSMFHDIWTKHFPTVKIGKRPGDSDFKIQAPRQGALKWPGEDPDSGSHPKCQLCTTIQTGLIKQPDKRSRAEFIALRQEHLNLQAECRKKYYKHIRKASTDKMEGRHLSIIIDNMDQAKSRLPSFCTNSKSDAHLYRLQHHITGVKVHNTNQTYLFTWTDAFRPDANITLNALVHVLSDLCKNFQRLPEVLYLQLDNSGKDNKNAFVLMFMAYLVKMKVFQKVKVGFLMVGHTHEDIDQVFSRVASWIRRRDMVTLQDLVDNLRDSQEPSPIVEQLTCYDYKHSLEGCRGLIQGIATPHHFIMTEMDGKVALRYRDWPGSPDHHLDIAGYIPQNFDAVGVTTNPKVLGEIQQMSADMVKWQATGRLSTTAVEWWTRYLAGVSDEREPCVPFVDTLPRQQPWSPPQQELATFLLSAARGQAAHVSRQVCLKIKKKKV